MALILFIYLFNFWPLRITAIVYCAELLRVVQLIYQSQAPGMISGPQERVNKWMLVLLLLVIIGIKR